MPGRRGQGKVALGPQHEGMGGGVHTGVGLFSGLFLVLRQGLWVALAILELCTLGLVMDSEISLPLLSAGIKAVCTVSGSGGARL